MRIAVLTSNRYHHFLPGFAYCWNKHWPANPADTVQVFGFDRQPPPLPGNFEFISLGEQAKLTWSQGCLKMIEHLAASVDKALIMLEDYWLDRPVDRLKVALAESWVDPMMNVIKCDLTDDRLKVSHHPISMTAAHSYQVIASAPDALFQTSLQAAVWYLPFMARFLEPSETPWQWEKKGTKRVIAARKAGTLHGDIVGFVEPPMHYVNACGGEGTMPHTFAKKRFPAEMWYDLLDKGYVKEPK